MALANEDRGGLVGAFIVEEGDEILSITQAGQVVRSPINDEFRATGRSTMGVKFVTPKSGDAVAVVARSVEARGREVDDERSAEDAPVRRRIARCGRRMQQSSVRTLVPRPRRLEVEAERTPDEKDRGVTHV